MVSSIVDGSAEEGILVKWEVTTVVYSSIFKLGLFHTTGTGQPIKHQERCSQDRSKPGVRRSLPLYFMAAVEETKATKVAKLIIPKAIGSWRRDFSINQNKHK